MTTENVTTINLTEPRPPLWLVRIEEKDYDAVREAGLLSEAWVNEGDPRETPGTLHGHRFAPLWAYALLERLHREWHADFHGGVPVALLVVPRFVAELRRVEADPVAQERELTLYTVTHPEPPSW